MSLSLRFPEQPPLKAVRGSYALDAFLISIPSVTHRSKSFLRGTASSAKLMNVRSGNLSVSEEGMDCAVAFESK